MTKKTLHTVNLEYLLLPCNISTTQNKTIKIYGFQKNKDKKTTIKIK